MTDSLSLAELREAIDALDSELLRLLNERAGLAQQVAQVKVAAGEQGDFYRADREAQVLRRIQSDNPGPLSNDDVTHLFRALMSSCLALEKPLTIAYLGPEGTFTQEAALKHFGHAVQTLPVPTIAEIFREVEGGAAHYGVVPVENSTEGVINHTLDTFLNSPLNICGEVELRIHHHLLSDETRLEDISTVYSHQQSLAQCREWLITHLEKAELVPVSSNAEAARLVAHRNNAAAIAGKTAAEMYDLQTLASNIEDEPDNTTRFLIIGQREVAPSGQDKTSLYLSTPNRAGALHGVLQHFAQSGISLNRIESRPSRRGAWDYVFFIDIDGHQKDPKVAEVLNGLKQNVSQMKVLGSYPKAVV